MKEPMQETKEKPKYKARVLSMIVNLDHEPIFADTATTVTIVDEAAGEFLEITQSTDEALMKLRVCKEEWPALRDTIEQMFILTK